MPISPEKTNELKQKMQRLGIEEDDLVEKFILGSGRGGQKINKTASCVYLKHLPTGTEVKCQKDRSREMNRYFARVMLCDRLEKALTQEKTKKEQEIEKIRRQKKRRARRTQQKLVEEKRERSQTKVLRKSPLERSD